MRNDPLVLGPLHAAPSHNGNQVKMMNDSKTAEVDLAIGGLSCASCTVTVERSLRALPGVQKAEMNYAQAHRMQWTMKMARRLHMRRSTAA